MMYAALIGPSVAAASRRPETEPRPQVRRTDRLRELLPTEEISRGLGAPCRSFAACRAINIGEDRHRSRRLRSWATDIDKFFGAEGRPSAPQNLTVLI